jgi:putative NIF3 family GTP cyclohydrolase 1 type 2
MIEDPKKEEDLNEEIEVEIDEEGHTESPSEEQPAPEPETPETEKEEEELDEEPEKEEDSTEPESEEEESDDKKVYGKRAEKRIKRLVKQRKELQEKLEALEAEKQKFQEEREELAGRTAESELEAVKQYGNRLKAQEKEILATLKDAKAQGDVDREIEATDKLASVKAEALIVKQYEQRAGRTSTTKKVSAEETAKKLEEKVAVPDRRAVQWQKRNSWFGGNDQSQKIMTQAAMVIHKELIEEGVYPDADPDEYYSELDARIRNEFPEKFKAEKSAKKVQVVAGGTRTSPSGKQKVTLTKSEVETANKLGVSLQEYAKQKMRRDQAAG